MQFIQAHGGLIAIGGMAFTVLSIILNAAAELFKALGKSAPGWVGTASDLVGKALHFINGNLQAAKPPVEAPAPEAPKA